MKNDTEEDLRMRELCKQSRPFTIEERIDPNQWLDRWGEEQSQLSRQRGFGKRRNRSMGKVKGTHEVLTDIFNGTFHITV